MEEDLLSNHVVELFCNLVRNACAVAQKTPTGCTSEQHVGFLLCCFLASVL